MKIHDRSLTGAGPTETGKTAESQKAGLPGTGRSAGADGGDSDRVELSGAIGRLSQALSSFGSSHAAKVQQLAADYQNGRYQADSGATGHAMISDALVAGAH